jgi:hypothetical protein
MFKFSSVCAWLTGYLAGLLVGAFTSFPKG